jgi:DNA-binding NarL/FixJ family response regulator
MNTERWVPDKGLLCSYLDDCEPSMKPMTVLVMEDAAVVRNLTIDLLGESKGIDTIIEAEDAVSALKLMAEHRPQIAVLDIKVPGGPELKNGVDVLKVIKESYPATAVIMLTNYASARYRTECMRLGADFFFDKSNEFDKLPAAVEELMRRTV